jgi:enamine deaminase RidA (YjgF/YER057c/UK114 family)
MEIRCMPHKTFNPPELHKPAGYSHLAEISGGKLIYIAGQVALDANGNIVGAGDLRAQIEQVFANLDAALKSAGAGFHNVAKLNCYCVESVDAAKIAVFREIRDRYVNTASPPASTFVYVTRLVRPEWLIEVEAVAAI